MIKVERKNLIETNRDAIERLGRQVVDFRIEAPTTLRVGSRRRNRRVGARQQTQRDAFDAALKRLLHTITVAVKPNEIASEIDNRCCCYYYYCFCVKKMRAKKRIRAIFCYYPMLN